MQKLLRAQGSNHIDHRLNQVDFSAQAMAPVMPWLGRSLESLEGLDAALIVGGSLRYEQPLLSHRLRKAALGSGGRDFLDWPSRRAVQIFRCMQNLSVRTRAW